LDQLRGISLIKRGDGVTAGHHCQHRQRQLVFDAEPELESWREPSELERVASHPTGVEELSEEVVEGGADHGSPAKRTTHVAGSDQGAVHQQRVAEIERLGPPTRVGDE
jgi:hypothetical protein